jgi:anti-sigma regulatory factor (Ser/Thr protein kinase)
MERPFPRNLDALEAVFDFVQSFLAASGVDPARAFRANLVSEELFTNAVRHGGGAADLVLALERDGDRLVIRLHDRDAAAFDVRAAPEVDTTLPLGERRAGGLGLHLVRKLAEDIDYRHQGGNATITVTVRLEAAEEGSDV